MACISSENFEQEFSEYISSTTDKYICFYDSSHTYEKNRIPILVSMLENVPSANGIICARNFIDSNGSLIAHPDFVYQDMMDDMVFDGKQLLTYSIANNINLYGNLSTILLSTDYIKTLCHYISMTFLIPCAMWIFFISYCIRQRSYTHIYH